MVFFLTSLCGAFVFRLVSMTLLAPPPTKPQMAESSDDLSPWIPPLFPASMMLLSPPPTPPTKPQMAEPSDDLSPWIPPLFPASMTLLSPPPPQPNPKWLVPSIHVRGWPLFVRGWPGFSVRGWLVCNVRRWLAFNVRRFCADDPLNEGDMQIHYTSSGYIILDRFCRWMDR